MRSSFASRRKARKIGQEDDEDEASPLQAGLTPRKLHPLFYSSIRSDNSMLHRKADRWIESSPLATKPTPSNSTPSQPKKKSALRLSFGPGEVNTRETREISSEVFNPKKSNLSRQAIEKNALRKSLAGGRPLDSLPTRPQDDENRPSYSRDYLEELKSSTPSTPKDLRSSDDENDNKSSLDIISKFGPLATQDDFSIIPGEAEIREKKARRARLAHENEYMTLDDEEESNEVSLLDRRKNAETRLVREDEDIAEGFDEFVDDGRITLGRKAEREQRRRQRADMVNLINEAENSSEEDSDESEAERRAAYEAAQTAAGTYGKGPGEKRPPQRPRTPPKITPIPSLNASLEWLHTALAGMESTLALKIQRMAELEHEKARIAQREVDIQRLLKEAGEDYERLRLEAEQVANANGNGNGQNGSNGQVMVNRGLESFGEGIAQP